MDPNRSRFDEWWPRLVQLGCTYERANDMLVAIDMSPEVNVHDAYGVLEFGSNAGVWDFDEGYYFNGDAVGS